VAEDTADTAVAAATPAEAAAAETAAAETVAAAAAPVGAVEWRYAPHMLAMSATPIPRTLAMCKHGEMALSCIDEKPAGRQLILTKILNEPRHGDAYKAMTDEVSAGGQCYIITPLITESAADRFIRFTSAEEEYERLKAEYPKLRFGILHGNMSSDEKVAALDAFTAGQTQVLVATSVVEVGVDVPNSSLIIILDADRHGLSSLHQLRGRVGRGKRASKCFLLITNEAGAFARDRMEIMVKSNNGFQIAEQDLRVRGPGNLLGTRQSGLQANLFHASVETDLYLLEAARKAAAETIARASIRGEGLPAPLMVALKERPPVLDLNV